MADPRQEWVKQVLGLTVGATASVVRGNEAAEIIKASGGGVIYAKLRLDWEAAFKAAQSHLDTFGKSVLAHSDAKFYPRLAELEEAVARLGNLLPEFGSRLNDVLDAARQAPDDQRPGLRAEAVKTIESYRTMLDEEPMLRELDTSMMGPVGAYSAVADALDKLKTQLA